MIYVSADGTSGYAVAARAYVEGFLQLAQPISWSPRAWLAHKPGHVTCPDAALSACLAQPVATDRVLLHVVPSQLDCLYREFSAYRKFVYTVWETERWPENWIEPLNRARGIFVPCRWNEQTLRQSGVTVPIEVIPHLVSPALARRNPAVPTQPFTFYCIGPWTQRKGMELLVEAFCRAFQADQPVRLLVKTGSKDLTRFSRRWGLRHLSNAWNNSQRALRRILTRHRRPPRVKLLHGCWTQEQIWDFHGQGHCYVSLTRAEGWGLGAFEAATLGNPVIMTGYGGQLDFLDPALSYQVEHRLVPCRVGAWESFYQGQSWAEPDLDHAARQMLEVYQNFHEAGRRAAQLKLQICRRYGWETVMPRFQAALSR